jgi:hypothetical protein
MSQERVSLEEAFVQLTGENVQPLVRDRWEAIPRNGSPAEAR